MKIVTVLFRLHLLALTWVSFNFVNGQIVINTLYEVTPEEMVEKIVGDGIQFSNVSYTGADSASGIFTNGSSTNLGLDEGIFLTTGSGYNIPGPNNSANASTNNGIPGNALLNNITTSPTYDASVLEFDFIPETDTLFIKYIFGSEEYNEFVGSAFNDVFGLFITGPNPMGGQYTNKNISIIPGTTNTSVKINSVNNGYSLPGVEPSGPCMNCQYYDDNSNGLTLEYDGFTVVLVSWLIVVPCEEYHAMIGIADVGDFDRDSGAFIEELSIKRPKIDVETILVPPDLTEHMVEGHVEADVVFRLPNPEYAPITICYEITGTASNGADYEWIDNCVTFEEGEDSVSFHIVPLYDGIIEGEETIVLIIENTLGCIVRYDTVEFTILDYLEMYSTCSPNTLICNGDSVELWVDVINGFPPYTYNWQPGSYTNDTIVVSPEETTTYTVTYSDIFGETGIDSVKVTVFNGNANNIIAFSFLAENNPLLPEDVYGTILEDSVLLVLPTGQTAENLIAAFSLPNCATAFVDGEEQFSSVSANDFTNPIIYQVVAANGELHDWLVVVEIELGLTGENVDGLILFPNPSDGKFYLEVENMVKDPIELQVVDLTGRIIYQTSSSSQDKTKIDLTDQPKGIYFIRVKAREMVVSRKVILK
jgi:hypothetical protein